MQEKFEASLNQNINFLFRNSIHQRQFLEAIYILTLTKSLLVQFELYSYFFGLLTFAG